MRNRILSICLSFCMVLSTMPFSAMAQEANAGANGEIISFAPLTQTDKTVTKGTTLKDLELPQELTATVRTAVDKSGKTSEEPKSSTEEPASSAEESKPDAEQSAPSSEEPKPDSEQPAPSSEEPKPDAEEPAPSSEEPIQNQDTATESISSPTLEGSASEQQVNLEVKTAEIPVTWDSKPEYDKNTEGVYVFTPVIKGYTLSAELPKITVTVETAQMMLRMGAPTTYGDFSVSVDEDGAAPTYNEGVLTFGTAGEYTVAMAGEKTTTSNVIMVNATGEVKLNLDGVNITAPNGAMYNVGGNALTVTSGTVTLNVIADCSLQGGTGGTAGMEITPAGNGGAGVIGNVTVTGTATLTVTGGSGGSGLMGTAGSAGMAISNASRSGGGKITVGEGYTVKAGSNASTAVVLTEATTNAQYVSFTPPDPVAGSTTYGDFSVSVDEDGVAPTYNEGVLTFGNAGEYTVGMAGEKTSTTDRIVVSAANVTLNLDGVTINAPNRISEKVDGDNAFTVTSDSVILNLLKDSSFIGGLAGIVDPMNACNGGSGISGNITLTGTATLTATGGQGGANPLSNTGNGGAGVSGNVTVRNSASLIAIGGLYGGANAKGGTGISGNLTVTGSATVSATGGYSSPYGSPGNALTGTLTATGFILKGGFTGLTDEISSNDSRLNQFRYLSVEPASLPTAAEYAAASPAATSDTDYALDSDKKTLTIKTAKGAAFWSASDKDYLDYTVLLADDIDVSAFQWTPVGTSDGSFTGSFNGQGHTITGMTVSVNNVIGSSIGLFGKTLNVTIENVGLLGSSVTVTEATGGYVNDAGSIVGFASKGKIKNCYSTGSVAISGTSIIRAGGIVSYASNVEIENCYNTGNVTTTGNNDTYAGGIVAFKAENTTVTNCYYLSTATITGTNSNLGNPLTEVQMKAGAGTENALIDSLNQWVNNKASTDYYTWQADSTSNPVNKGYPVFGVRWAELQARWGVGGIENAAPDTWGGSGSLTDAVAYANSLTSGTAYIQLITNVDTTAALVFAQGKTAVLDLNSKTIDGNSISGGSGADKNILTVKGSLTLCDSSTVTVANQGKITGGHGTVDGMGGGVYVDGSGTFFMSGGNITGNTAVNGGGVGNKGTFTMSGGSIAGNTCVSVNSDSAPCGGGVMNLYEFNMSGGGITGNTVVVGGAGGGVLDAGGGTTLSGNVNISGNTVGTASDNVALMGAGSGDGAVKIAGALTNSTAIGVSMVRLWRDNVFIPQAGVFTFGDSVTNSDYISKFVSDNSGFAVIADGGQLKLAASQSITKADATNGSFSVKVNGNALPSAIEGQTVTITPTANSGYEVDAISVCKTGDTNTTVTVSSNAFTMPVYPVTIRVTFKKKTVDEDLTGVGYHIANGKLTGTTGNMEYNLDGGSTWKPCTQGETANLTFTAGSVKVRQKGKTTNERTVVTIAVPAASTTPTLESKTVNSVKLNAIAGYEYSKDGGITWQNSNVFLGLTANTAYHFVARKKATATTLPGTLSAELSVTTAQGSSSDKSSDSNNSTPAPSNKPTEPVTGETANKAVIDGRGTASVRITDQNIADAIANAKAEAEKKGLNAGEITVKINVSADGANATNFSVNLPKSTQQQVIGNKVAGIELAIDRPDLTLGINLAAVTEINRQANADVQLTVTRTDATRLSPAARNTIGSRPTFDFKASFENASKQITNFGNGAVYVSVPYTPANNEAVGYLYMIYVDASGNAVRVPGSAYDVNSKSLIFVTNHFSVYGVGYTAPPAQFTDISRHWAKESIDYAVGRGLFGGRANAKFTPDTAITRGDLVTVLGKLAGVNVASYAKSSFTDVKAGSYYMPYLEWAYSKGILTGNANNKIAPERAVTREEIAVILQNYMRVTGRELPATRSAGAFADTSSIGNKYQAAVAAMQQAGVLMGKKNNQFAPKANATRAEVSAMLHRYTKLTIDPTTAQGWARNDAGEWMFFMNGKPVTGAKEIDGFTYTFDPYGITADIRRKK